MRRNIAEIEADPALRAYGAALAVLHVLAYVHWNLNQPLASLLDQQGVALCWPFLPGCADWRVFDAPTIARFLLVYALTAVGAILCFAERRATAAGWVLLLVLEGVSLALVLQDYRLRLNQHYMAAWATGAFLLARRKREVLPLLLVSFYFWAGLLKLNPEWLSGAGLYGRRPLGLPEAWLPAACLYVVVLELGFVWGLLARRAWIFWACLAQFLLFHVASWNVVGFYYPLLMFALLSVLPMLRWQPAPPAAPRRLAPALPVLAFSLLQLPPFAFPGDTAVTGEGRWLSLHMFDAPVSCSARATLHRADGSRFERTLVSAPLLVPQRIACDPLVFLGMARHLCRQNASRQEFVDLDLRLDAARSGAPLRSIVAIDAVCTRPPRYRWWGHNDWIDVSRLPPDQRES